MNEPTNKQTKEAANKHSGSQYLLVEIIMLCEQLDATNNSCMGFKSDG